MSLAVALSLTEVQQGSRTPSAEERFGPLRAELFRHGAGSSLRAARILFESWLRGCLRLANGGAAAAGDLNFPRASIEFNLDERHFPGASGNEFCRLRDELSRRLGMLDALVREMRGHWQATPSIWNQMVEAALEILSLFSALDAERAALMASVDPLTGLGGRRALEECLQQEWARMRREGRSCAIALLDIDHFKDINDRQGHLSGDQVLARFAALLRSNLRSYDGIYRYGGEEFVLCLPGVDAGLAKRMVDRIREAAGQMPFLAAGGSRLRITFSAGVAELASATSPSQALESADRALYQAKADGRNRVYVSAFAAQPHESPDKVS